MSVSTAKAPSSDGEFEVIDTKKLSSGMRNRKKSQAELLVEGTIDGAAKLVPEDYKPYVEMLKPAVEPVFNIIHMLIPYVFMIGSLLKDVWEKAQPYHPQELGGAFLGLLMVFFGGTYVTTIAAVEAFRQCGWERTEKHLKILFANYEKAAAASKKDDDKDEDGDGIPDVQQLSSNELYRRKALLVAKSVNPDDVSNALAGIWSGIFGVLCTLRIQFAHAITLGAAIGDVLHSGAHKYLEPTLNEIVPKEYHKWVPTIVKYSCRCIAVSIAWIVQRVISAFHSAIRGSELALTGICAYLKRHGHIKEVPETGSQLWFGLHIGLAVMGFLWQLRLGFSLPFPINILFLPLSIFEWILVNVVGSNL